MPASPPAKDSLTHFSRKTRTGTVQNGGLEGVKASSRSRRVRGLFLRFGNPISGPSPDLDRPHRLARVRRVPASLERVSVANRWFTPDTARLALDTLRPAAETLSRLYGELEHTRPARIDPDQPVDPAYFERVVRIHAALEARSAGAGCVVSDLKTGRARFPGAACRSPGPALLAGGEADPGLLARARAAGPGGRRPVDEDGPWEDG